MGRCRRRGRARSRERAARHPDRQQRGRGACTSRGTSTWCRRGGAGKAACPDGTPCGDRKSTRLNSSHTVISYAVFCLKKKKKKKKKQQQKKQYKRKQQKQKYNN